MRNTYLEPKKLSGKIKYHMVIRMSVIVICESSTKMFNIFETGLNFLKKDDSVRKILKLQAMVRIDSDLRKLYE